ncbi:MAG TPA: large conductance mechanosensitive channel protein MscL [Granulicella sp.]
MLKGFRDFILRGNVVDLAVAVIIGAAFGAITNSLVSDVINPFIAAIIGKPDFSALVLHLNFHPAMGAPDATAGVIKYGNFLNALISFLLNAAVVYFFIVMPLQKLLARLHPAEAPAAPAATKVCPECLSEIPVAAHRCKFCAQPVAA